MIARSKAQIAKFINDESEVQQPRRSIKRGVFTMTVQFYAGLYNEFKASMKPPAQPNTAGLAKSLRASIAPGQHVTYVYLARIWSRSMPGRPSPYPQSTA